MLKSQDLHIARLMKQRIQKIIPVKRFIVFGSRARGNADQDSDLDCFIETTNVTPDIRSKVYDIAWEVGFDHDIVISTFLASSSLLVNSPLAANPLLRAIEVEGIAI